MNFLGSIEWNSRKLLLAVSGILIILFRDKLGLSGTVELTDGAMVSVVSEELEKIITLIMSYIVGQGVVDVAKAFKPKV